MAEKSVDTIVYDVALCLDEIDDNEAEFLVGTDSDDVGAVINSKIADAIRYVYLNADRALISPTVNGGTAKSNSKGVVSITLGDDFLRLCFASLSDWDTPVTEAIHHTDKRYAALKNPITTGYPDNPKAAIVDDVVSNQAKRRLELYSSRTKGGDVTYTYGYISSPSMVNGGYNIDDRLYRAVVYQIAGLTLQAFKDAHADSMFNMALTIMK